MSDTNIYCSGIGDTGVCRVNYSFFTKKSSIQANTGTSYITNSLFYRTTSVFTIRSFSSLIIQNITMAEGSGITAIVYNSLKSGNHLSRSSISGNFSALITNQKTVLTIETSIIGPNPVGNGFTALPSGTTYFYNCIVCFLKRYFIFHFV